MNSTNSNGTELAMQKATATVGKKIGENMQCNIIEKTDRNSALNELSI